jgi:hypothetical protein
MDTMTVPAVVVLLPVSLVLGLAGWLLWSWPREAGGDLLWQTRDQLWDRRLHGGNDYDTTWDDLDIARLEPVIESLGAGVGNQATGPGPTWWTWTAVMAARRLDSGTSRDWDDIDVTIGQALCRSSVAGWLWAGFTYTAGWLKAPGEASRRENGRAHLTAQQGTLARDHAGRVEQLDTWQNAVNDARL